MSTEHAIQTEILTFCQRPNVKLWRNNSGAFVIGQGAQRRFFRSGLCKGSSDIIGFKAEGRGRSRRARFVAIEVKGEGGRVSPEQQEFLNTVQRAGGIAGVAWSIEDAMALLGLDRSDA